MIGYKIVSEALDQHGNAILYHVTLKSNLDNIDKYGLDPSKSGTNYQRGFYRTLMKGVYLSTDTEYIIEMVKEKSKGQPVILVHCSVPLTKLLIDEDTIRWEMSMMLRNIYNQMHTHKVGTSVKQVSGDKRYLKFLKNLYKDITFEDVISVFYKEYSQYPRKYIEKILHALVIHDMYLFYHKKDHNLGMNDLKDYREIMTRLVLDSNKQAIKKIKKKGVDDHYVVMETIHPRGSKKYPRIERITIV
jgi:uncharacterized phage-associated protein